MIIVSDTSPINYLILIEQIDVLQQLYGRVIAPTSVHRELQAAETPDAVRSWLSNRRSSARDCFLPPHRLQPSKREDCYNIGRKTHMSQLNVDLPPEVSEDEARLLLAMKLFETGRLSLEQAAKMADYTKQAFMEILAKAGIPVFDYPADELKDEIGV